MSSEIGRSLYASTSSGEEQYDPTQWFVSDGNIKLNHYTSSYTDAFARVSSNGYAYTNADGLDLLYPNATAHPTKATVEMRIRSYSLFSSTRWAVRFGGTEIYYASRNFTSYETYTSGTLTSSSITSSYKGSSRIDVYGSSSNGGIRFVRITLYFMRYDFSATAGSGVTSASVSSSTGYDGDPVTFSCVVPTGYVFDGWYNGNTLVSSLPHCKRRGFELDSKSAPRHPQRHRLLLLRHGHIAIH